MRPDEHKRKKNAQYKRKHGISTKPTSKQESQEKTSVKQEGAKFQSHNISARNVAGVDEHSSDQSDEAEECGNDDIKQNPAQRGDESKRFAARKIKSNWEKYELFDDEIDANARRGGADFQTVLETGAQGERFRFKDELSWDSDDTESFIALDATDLAEALKCIPLPDRLGIDEALFGKDELHRFHTIAREHSEHYEHRRQLIGNDSTHAISIMSLSNDNNSSLRADPVHGSESRLNAALQEKVPFRDTIPNSDRTSKHFLADVTAGRDVVAARTSLRSVADIADEEDLDALLSMALPSTSSHRTSPSRHKKEEEEEGELSIRASLQENPAVIKKKNLTVENKAIAVSPRADVGDDFLDALLSS